RTSFRWTGGRKVVATDDSRGPETGSQSPPRTESAPTGWTAGLEDRDRERRGEGLAGRDEGQLGAGVEEGVGRRRHRLDRHRVEALGGEDLGEGIAAVHAQLEPPVGAGEGE